MKIFSVICKLNFLPVFNPVNVRKTNSYLNKIINSQSSSFFEFTISREAFFSLVFCTDNLFDLLDIDLGNKNQLSDIFLDERIHPLDYNYFIHSVFYAQANGTEFSVEFRIITSTNEIRWIKATAKTEQNELGTSFYGVAYEVTKYKVEIENLRSSDARNQFANEASGAGVWDWDLQTNEVFYSKESLRILELDNATKHLIDSPEKWDERVHPNDREEYYYNIKQHFEGKTPYYETYHRVLCNNRYKWILDKGKVISRDKDGKPLRIVGTHTDVTLLKENERKAYETLQIVSNQNNKLSNFAHIVSHNLRNHTGNLSLLIKMKEEGEFDVEEAFGYIKSVSIELNETIHNLMELVKIQNIEEVSLEDLNLHHALLKVLTVISEEITKKEVAVVNLIPNDLTVNCNPAFLESIMLNLTTNAIKYSDENRNIHIEYSVDDEPEFIVLNVKDNGLGIDLERYKDDVFGLYKTFHRKENSNGIGLYITKNQIESMSGKIEVESKVNEGSTFKVYFKKK